MTFMRILLTAAVAASLAAGTMTALAQTAPAKPAKPVACKKIKVEADCMARSDCAWKAPAGKQKTGKCAAAKK
jgi:hypothetical protein